MSAASVPSAKSRIDSRDEPARHRERRGRRARRRDATRSRALRRTGSRQHSVFPANAIRVSRRRSEISPRPQASRRQLSQKHRVSSGGRSHHRAGQIGARTGSRSIARHRCGIFAALGGIFRLAAAALRRQMETRLRELPPAGRARPSRAVACAQRFAARRCIPDAADQRRPDSSSLHQHQSFAESCVDHQPDVRRDRPAICQDAGLAAPAKLESSSRRRFVESRTPRTCRARIDRRTTISCIVATTR